MAVRFDDARVQTMLGLYSSLAQEHDADRIEILETALDFTLSEDREARSEFQFRRDVMRNAQYTVNRAAMTRRQAAEKFPLADAFHRRFTWIGDFGVVEVDIETRVTPDEVVIAQETLHGLHMYANAMGSYGTTCLQALIAGLTTAETAVAAGVSVSTVERCWRALRAEARAMTTRDEDAQPF